MLPDPRDGDPLHHPLRHACPFCGVEVDRPGRCIDDIGRGGSVGAWIALALAIAAVVTVVLLIVWLASATPRPAAEPSSRLVATQPLTGAPHVPGGIQSALGEVRESAVGWHRYPDPVPGGAPLTLDPRIGREGLIAHTGSSVPYLAIPLGPGVRVRICGPSSCLVATSTDAGPNRAMLLAGRIADLDIPRWEAISGVSARYGLTQGSWMVITGPRPTLPPTSTKETQP